FMAVDLATGEEVALRRGLVWLNSRASASIPGIFPPARVDGRWLVDGGVSDPIPCRAVRELGADIVLGVSLEGEADQIEGGKAEFPQGASTRAPAWPAALYRAFDLQQRSFARLCLKEADVPIRAFAPPAALNFDGGPRFLEAGERAVEAAEARLRLLLPWAGRQGC